MIGLKDAVKGAPVAAFWPAAACVVLYSEAPTSLNLAFLIMTAFFGSVTYTTMRQVKILFEEARNKTSRPRGRGRSSKQKSRSDYITELTKTTLELMPASKKIRFFIASCILADVLALITLFVIFSHRVVVGENITVGFTGLTMLPTTYVLVIISILIWNR